MLKKILIGLVAVVAVLAVVVALQPSEYSISRTATVAAPAPAVFAQVNDFHNWEAWSPWAKLDPTAKNSFEGAPAGKGAAFSRAGSSKVGEGRMTITESRPSELVRFKPEGERTAVTWSM